MQLSELMRLAGMEPLPLSGSPSVQASLAKLRAAASSTAATSELDGAARAEVQGWLQQQLSPLSEQLGCSLKVLPPWAERVANRAKCVAKGGTAAAAGSRQQPHQQQQAQGASDNVGNGLPSAAAAADAPAAKVPTAAYIHPYTELMLRHPVQQHTMQQAVEAQAPETLLPSRQTTAAREDVAAAAAAAAGAEGCAAANGSAGEVDVSTPAASLLAATPASAGFLSEVPSLADLSCLSEQRTQLTAGGAAGGGDTAGTAGMGSQMLLDGLAFDLCAAGAASPMDVAALGSGSTALARASGRARGISNYALLAGKKGGSRSHTGPPKKAARAASSRQEVDLGPQHPVARAVAALVAAGDPDSSAAGHWDGCAAGCSQLLAAAPEDEVLAEMLALQVGARSGCQCACQCACLCAVSSPGQHLGKSAPGVALLWRRAVLLGHTAKLYSRCVRSLLPPFLLYRTSSCSKQPSTGPACCPRWLLCWVSWMSGGRRRRSRRERKRR